MKFKVGDKVRVLDRSSLYFGEIGLVVSLYVDCYHPYKVSVDDELGGIVFKEEDLELIEEPKESLIDELVDAFEIPKLIKDIRLDKLKQLIKAVNTLGEFGKEVELKITIELDGKKIEL